MDTKALNEMVETNIEAAEEVTGYEMTDADLEYTQRLIAQIAGKYVKRQQDKDHKRKVKAKNRAANKVAKQSRKKNRK